MPACTEAERELIELNVSTKFDRDGLWKARRAVRLERLEPDVREKIVRLYMAKIRSDQELRAYLEALRPTGVLEGDYGECSSVASLLEAEAEERIEAEAKR